MAPAVIRRNNPASVWLKRSQECHLSQAPFRVPLRIFEVDTSVCARTRGSFDLRYNISLMFLSSMVITIHHAKRPLNMIRKELSNVGPRPLVVTSCWPDDIEHKRMVACNPRNLIPSASSNLSSNVLIIYCRTCIIDVPSAL